MIKIVLLLLLAVLPAFPQSGFWTPVTSCSAGAIHALMTSPDGCLFAATDYDGLLFRSTDKGQSWSAADSGLTQYTSVQALARDSSGGLLAGTPVGLYRSTDNGTHWEPAGFSGRGINAVAVGQNGAFYAVMMQGVYRSTNLGASWDAVDTSAMLTIHKCITIAHDGTLLVGSLPYTMFGVGGLRRSTDHGASWNDVTDGLYDDRVRALATAPNGDLYLGIDTGGVYRSTDAGETWNLTSLTQHAIYSIAADGTGNVFAATNDAGVYRSTSDGDTWIPVNDGLTTFDVRSVTIDADGYVYAGTSGYGIFRSATPLTTTGKDAVVPPASFALHQGYPNPFNPATTISYDLPYRTDVRLTVFDILGREVALLVDRREEAGTKTVRWNAGGAASGVYFVQLRAGGMNAVTRIVLAK